MASSLGETRRRHSLLDNYIRPGASSLVCWFVVQTRTFSLVKPASGRSGLVESAMQMTVGTALFCRFGITIGECYSDNKATCRLASGDHYHSIDLLLLLGASVVLLLSQIVKPRRRRRPTTRTRTRTRVRGRHFECKVAKIKSENES